MAYGLSVLILQHKILHFMLHFIFHREKWWSVETFWLPHPVPIRPYTCSHTPMETPVHTIPLRFSPDPSLDYGLLTLIRADTHTQTGPQSELMLQTVDRYPVSLQHRNLVYCHPCFWICSILYYIVPFSKMRVLAHRVWEGVNPACAWVWSLKSGLIWASQTKWIQFILVEKENV